VCWQCTTKTRHIACRAPWQEDVMELTTTRWDVQVFLSEKDGTTRAEARLFSGLPRHLTATGTARLAPDDPQDVPEVGYELATARALLNLGEQLLRTAKDDVDALNQP
jgi:hypothetical protein